MTWRSAVTLNLPCRCLHVAHGSMKHRRVVMTLVTLANAGDHPNLRELHEKRGMPA